MARSTLYPLLVVTCLGVVCARAAAQSGGDLATPAGAEAPNMVKLNFPEQLPLALLVNYVAKRHNINFIHKGDVLGMKKVTLKARHRIPSDELLPLLKSALNMHSLVIVPTDVAGVMRIEKGGDLHKTAVWPELDDANRVDGQGVTSAVTRVFRIEHAQVTRADEVVKRYLSASQASTYPIEEQDLLIVTDFTENMPRIADVLAL
ncbi:MAG: hypothetical protein GVY24_04970, partial [Planctomycetes bacterium]|nr:hypothetical protein [Planctomycetota bacterium]